MLSLDDTIVAISTPLGEGGIGIVRMTGPEAAAILQRLFLPASNSSCWIMEPRTLYYGHILDPATGEFVDEVLAAHMPAPRTFTRQDVVEIDGHGGIVALQRILGLCLGEGARLAGPGEFTARAFLNGRLDLAQAEAVLDVVRAKTEASLRVAMGQLGGALSDRIRVVRDGLVNALAYLEASIDFAEDEIPEHDIGLDLERGQAGLSQLIDDAERGIIYRQGVRTAIVGRPNVGKSSLLNRLLRASRAIVTDIPGTTRDTLEETLNLQGIPMVLVDTAGISARTQDPIERLGIERSQAALAQADLALLVVDTSQPPAEADWSLAGLLDGKPAILVLNKIDLLDCASRADLPVPFDAICSSYVPISALTGEGLEELEKSMVATVLSGRVVASDAPAVANPRHKEALSRALDHVNAAYVAYQNGLVADLVSIDLAAAVNALGEITGQTASEDLIDAIFGNFCIGK
jgi:tRNA modification GTPase